MTARADIERRFQTEVRATGRRLEGYAATFGSQAKIGGFTETIEPGAFRASLLSGADILALADHDPGKVLGRTKSGTLILAEDAKGLRFGIDMPNTQIGNDLIEMAKRGDLGGMSFGFVATDEAWPSRDRRILRAVDLKEISVVQSWPAYQGTTVQARAAAQQATFRARYIAAVLGDIRA
jgi:HK97 family phage prohead protease